MKESLWYKRGLLHTVLGSPSVFGFVERVQCVVVVLELVRLF